MINEFEFFHGVVFARMLHALQRELSIKPYSTTDNAAYLINGTAAVYIKYSKKRLSPWHFSFQRRHREKFLQVLQSVGNCFLILVCNDDGVVILTSDEVSQILHNNQSAVEWISVTRNRRQMYSLRGSHGELTFKIGRDEFHKMLASLGCA
jgi:hypothetical protein